MQWEDAMALLHDFLPLDVYGDFRNGRADADAC